MPLKSAARPLPTGGSKSFLPKYRQSRFTPHDDQRLLRSSSFEELQATIRAVAAEAHYSERAVKRHAQKLGIWDKLVSPRRQITAKERMGIKALLRFSNSNEELLVKLAAKLEIGTEDARRLLYRDSVLKESLIEGTYSLREVADGLCMRPGRIKQIIDEGKLRAKRLQKSGKLFITSDSISAFVQTEPRMINWDRCFKKSLWLKDILESTREEELAVLLCVPKERFNRGSKMGFSRSCSIQPASVTSSATKLSTNSWMNIPNWWSWPSVRRDHLSGLPGIQKFKDGFGRRTLLLIVNDIPTTNLITIWPWAAAK